VGREGLTIETAHRSQ